MADFGRQLRGKNDLKSVVNLSPGGEVYKYLKYIHITGMLEAGGIACVGPGLAGPLVYCEPPEVLRGHGDMAAPIQGLWLMVTGLV